jgi:hypothetical protein
MTASRRPESSFGIEQRTDISIHRAVEALPMKLPETNPFRLPPLVLSVLRAADQGRQLV